MSATDRSQADGAVASCGSAGGDVGSGRRRGVARGGAPGVGGVQADVEIDEAAREAVRDPPAMPFAKPSRSGGVKFKSAEGVGPVGEGRSCEAQAVVLLVAKST